MIFGGDESLFIITRDGLKCLLFVNHLLLG